LLAPHRKRKWLHAGATAESDRRVLGDPPSNGADFDAAPDIRQINVDAAVVLGEVTETLRCGPSNWACASSTLSAALSAAGLGASQVRSY
jgi:hypothetical protein